MCSSDLDLQLLVQGPGEDMADQVNQAKAFGALHLAAEHVGDHKGRAMRVLAQAGGADIHRQADAQGTGRRVGVKKAASSNLALADDSVGGCNGPQSALRCTKRRQNSPVSLTVSAIVWARRWA